MELAIILLLLGLIYVYNVINPQLDYNNVTNEKIIWFNDPFDCCTRKSIVLYKNRKNKK
jgi:hypothetical protein